MSDNTPVQIFGKLGTGTVLPSKTSTSGRLFLYKVEKILMDKTLKNAKNELVSDIGELEFVEWGRDVLLSVRNNPAEQPALYTAIPVHKLILIARSPVFRAMLSGEMKDAVNSEVIIEDCSPDAIKSLISFMYSGSLEFTCIPHCAAIYAAADKYGVVSLAKLCEVNMLQKLQKSVSRVEKGEFLTIWNAADENNMLKVERACLNFLVMNSEELKQSWSFPSFLTHKQALRLNEYPVGDEDLPDLVSEEEDSDY